MGACECGSYVIHAEKRPAVVLPVAEMPIMDQSPERAPKSTERFLPGQLPGACDGGPRCMTYCTSLSRNDHAFWKERVLVGGLV